MMEIVQRFMRYVEQVTESGCWIWTGGESRKGYGKFWLNGSTPEVHRVAYTLFRGSIPPGMTIDHLCRVRCCVNPAHLEVVTNKENVLRGNGLTAQNAKKTHCHRGHEFTADNTHVLKLGRSCIACERWRQAP